MRRIVEETIRWVRHFGIPPFQSISVRALVAATLMVAATSPGLTGSTTAFASVRTTTQITLPAPVAVDIPPEVVDPNFNAWQPPQPVRVIPLPGLPDIAMVRMDAYGPYIVYNPVIVAQTPPKVDAFFLAHEYGHIYLNTGNEVAADEFAAQIYAQVDPSVVRAAAWWMTAFPNGGDMTHPPSAARARNICRISGAC
jgi:hypothetical protein